MNHSFREVLDMRRAYAGGVVILLLLASVDVVFIFLHVAAKHDLVSEMFSVTEDHSYPELYQYIKEFWCILLLALIAFRNREISYGGWVVFFVYLLADDSLQIHEQGGAAVASYFQYSPFLGLRAKDFGELTVSLLAALVLLLLLSWAYWKGADRFRKLSQDLVIFIIGLVFFGVFVDMLHIMVYSMSGFGNVLRLLGGILGITEDGGEMLVMSILVVYLFVFLTQPRVLPLPLWKTMYFWFWPAKKRSSTLSNPG
jgi:hypothetical protein